MSEKSEQFLESIIQSSTSACSDSLPPPTKSTIMHLIRRAALRAASSPSTSFFSKPRSVTTSSPFLLRSKIQPSISQSAFRRFASGDAHDVETRENSEESVDTSDRSSFSSALDSATDSASSYASDAAESLTRNAEQAKDALVDTAAGVASAAGFAYGGSAPRGNSSQRDEGRTPITRSYGGDRGSGAEDGNQSRYPARSPANPAGDRVIAPAPSIYVGNLLFDITAQDIEKEFEQYGTVKNVIIASDSRGLSKGFGYVEFETIEQATAAIEARHETMLEGRRLVVNYMAKTQRSNAGVVNPPSKTLFIGNLAFEMTDGDLNKLFRNVRNVIDVRVAIDRRTGQPRGFAHADFVDIESAVKGMEDLRDKEVYGRKLRLDFSVGGERKPTYKGSWESNEAGSGPRGYGKDDQKY